MRRTVLLGVLAAGLLATCAHAGKTRVILVFGDSYSDEINTLVLTNKTNAITPDPPALPPPENYYEGRQTNEPGTWTDQIDTENTTTAVRVFAGAGATACTWDAWFDKYPILSIIPSLVQQVDKFLERFTNTSNGYQEELIGPSFRPQFPLIWAGNTELYYLPDLPAAEKTALPDKVVTCLETGAKALLDQPKIKHLILATVAPQDLTPWAKADNASAAIKTAVTAINAGIKELVTSLSTAYPDANITLWDAHATLTDIVTTYQAKGFTTLEPCLKGEQYDGGLGIVDPTAKCDNPGDHVWYDTLFPSAAVHDLLQADLLDLLQAEGLLDPGLKAPGAPADTPDEPGTPEPTGPDVPDEPTAPAGGVRRLLKL